MAWGALVDVLSISQTQARSLKARVLDFIFQSQWCLPNSFQIVFPYISQQIENIELYSKWSPAMDGLVYFRSALEICRVCGPNFKWFLCIWQSYIPS